MLSSPSTRSKVLRPFGLSRRADTKTRMADCWTEGGFLASKRSRSVSMDEGDVKRIRDGGCRSSSPWSVLRVDERRGSTDPGGWESRLFKVVKR